MRLQSKAWLHHVLGIRKIDKRAIPTVVSGLLLVSVAINVLLAHRLKYSIRAAYFSRQDRLLKIGTMVPPIAAKRLDGEPGLISYQGAQQSTVLYIFTPPCSWCGRNMENFKTLLDKGRGQYHFVGLSLSEKDLTEYVEKNDLKLPIYSGLSPETLTTYKLGNTPQTIVISPEGKVLQDWAGAYVGDLRSQVEAFFHVTLPGLRELPKAEASKE
jgi:peroxiredoxin